jgi:hypothetical protein
MKGPNGIGVWFVGMQKLSKAKKKDRTISATNKRDIRAFLCFNVTVFIVALIILANISVI